MHPIDLTTPVILTTSETARVMGRAFVVNEWRYDFMMPDRRYRNNQPMSQVERILGKPWDVTR